ncbi:hypothetical protein B0H11DRAFT_1731273, partial [Mycena galericulata]
PYSVNLICLTVIYRDPLFILDSEGRIVTIFVGTPEDSDWPDVIQDAINELNRAREEALDCHATSPEDSSHRRGNSYVPFLHGASLGGGQRRPGMLVTPPRLRPIVGKILKNKNVRRICGLQSSALANFAPKMFQDYVASLKALFEHHPDLRHNFSNSIFPAVTFNCGPRTVTFDHRDFNNRPDGFCGITCGGDFNPRTSAHLYLKQLRIVVEFPSGATALIPSGSVDHGNTPLQPRETRCSITQYAAGALFRWVKYGFKSGKQLLRERGGAVRKAAYDGEPGERARQGLDLFSKADELAADHAKVFSMF